MYCVYIKHVKVVDVIVWNGNVETITVIVAWFYLKVFIMLAPFSKC